MRTREELDEQWNDLPALPRDAGTVRHIVIRKARGVHEVVETAELSPELGVHGDRWKADDGDPLAQVTIMNIHVVRLIRVADDQPLHTPGDNFLVDLDLSEAALATGTRLRIGEALVELTPEPHLGCKKFRERFGEAALGWINDKANRHLRLRGINCRVIESGMVSVGDPIRVIR